jgi:hypothetical protein
VLAPDRVDQRSGGDDAVRAQEEDREDGPLLPPADGDDVTLVLHLERAEYPKLHLAPPGEATLARHPISRRCRRF